MCVCVCLHFTGMSLSLVRYSIPNIVTRAKRACYNPVVGDRFFASSFENIIWTIIIIIIIICYIIPCMGWAFRIFVQRRVRRNDTDYNASFQLVRSTHGGYETRFRNVRSNGTHRCNRVKYYMILETRRFVLFLNRIPKRRM